MKLRAPIRLFGLNRTKNDSLENKKMKSMVHKLTAMHSQRRTVSVCNTKPFVIECCLYCLSTVTSHVETDTVTIVGRSKESKCMQRYTFIRLPLAETEYVTRYVNISTGTTMCNCCADLLETDYNTKCGTGVALC